MRIAQWISLPVVVIVGAFGLWTELAYGKPWTFRPNDLWGWWSQAHIRRVGGIETSVTAFVPGAKPIWLTEIGIPAVDKGANAPNMFPDPKSDEGGYPPFSSGARDDLVQVRGDGGDDVPGAEPQDHRVGGDPKGQPCPFGVPRLRVVRVPI